MTAVIFQSGFRFQQFLRATVSAYRQRVYHEIVTSLNRDSPILVFNFISIYGLRHQHEMQLPILTLVVERIKRLSACVTVGNSKGFRSSQRL
ncbi:uncharacterized protein PHALS_03707 [Plasmopara halstedii]|uniref:Uncharacterized protein n=1 Tax=Plasmopara halstedii TaxID=4781 RepID=A0A0P1B075_PLAHL|nr:uncharacterized protein PHALS_03707 [Plasmopara halstedii]CEG47044.1 hypothetical protein PHALS_03707 [Plasmopara halstedii]|eukprot:XP_024583413.1 hypothetical protein PHALS_03707 [Plasmopara halstedii]